MTAIACCTFLQCNASAKMLSFRNNRTTIFHAVTRCDTNAELAHTCRYTTVPMCCLFLAKPF